MSDCLVYQCALQFYSFCGRRGSQSNLFDLIEHLVNSQADSKAGKHMILSGGYIGSLGWCNMYVRIEGVCVSLVKFSKIVKNVSMVPEMV